MIPILFIPPGGRSRGSCCSSISTAGASRWAVLRTRPASPPPSSSSGARQNGQQVLTSYLLTRRTRWTLVRLPHPRHLEMRHTPPSAGTGVISFFKGGSHTTDAIQKCVTHLALQIFVGGNEVVSFSYFLQPYFSFIIFFIRKKTF